MTRHNQVVEERPDGTYRSYKKDDTLRASKFAPTNLSSPPKNENK